ncbi:MAG: AAA family ATPase [Thermodesulfobacteriota bacterium]
MDKELNLPLITEKIALLRNNIKKHIKGKDNVINYCLCALFSGGHVLIEDIPGVGKTTLAYTIASSINLEFSRIQFTSDLLPADIIGVSVYDQKTNEFDFKSGPIFANIVLADEINRTTPKTQSALLEAMNESCVTVDGKSYDLPRPFMVIATQNPFEYHGTFPLPESQLDRFSIKLNMGYPDLQSEKSILSNHHSSTYKEEVNPVLDIGDLNQIKTLVQNVHIEEEVLDYILSIVNKTRDNEQFDLGISPRGAIILKNLSMANAVVDNRTYVTPDDVKKMVIPAFSHRVVLKAGPNSHGKNENEVLTNLLKDIKVPI